MDCETVFIHCDLISCRGGVVLCVHVLACAETSFSLRVLSITGKRRHLIKQ